MTVKKFQQGFSLVETLIASAVFSLVIVLYIQVRGLVFKQEKIVDDKFNEIRILLTIKDEIIKDDPFIIPHNLPAADALFDDFNISGFRCYERDASVKDVNYTDPNVDLEKECNYQVSFYKVAVSIPATGRTRAPLSQYHIRVKYFVGSGSDKRAEQIILRPFVTSVQYN